MARSSGELWLVGGPNGAGKSTFIERATGPSGILAGAPAPNLDRHTNALLREAGHDPATVAPEVYWHYFKQADDALQREIRERISSGQIIWVETVFSTDKYRAAVDFALFHGLAFRLIYVMLSNPELAQDRVAKRVRGDGHSVPAGKIAERFYRSLENLPVLPSWRMSFGCLTTRFPTGPSR